MVSYSIIIHFFLWEEIIITFDLKDKNLEHVNVQQAGKNELKKVLKENSLNIVLKAAYYAKKKGEKQITKQEIEKALKK
jgi:histone H3/H4